MGATIDCGTSTATAPKTKLQLQSESQSPITSPRHVNRRASQNSSKAESTFGIGRQFEELTRGCSTVLKGGQKAQSTVPTKKMENPLRGYAKVQSLRGEYEVEDGLFDPQGDCMQKAMHEEKLLMMARAGEFKGTVEALAEGADLHRTNLRGQNALMLASASHSPAACDTVRFLVEMQGELEGQDNAGWTALCHACRNSRQNVVELLLEKGAHIKAVTHKGETTMMLATIDGSSGLVNYLVANKAGIDRKDHLGFPSLFYAVQAGHLHIVKSLLRRNADVKAKAKDGETALILVAKQGDMTVAEVLLRKHVNINAQDKSGSTAMMEAIRNGFDAFAIYLIDEGGDFSIKDEDGEDARSIAENMGMMSLKYDLDVRLRAERAERDDDDDD